MNSTESAKDSEQRRNAEWYLKCMKDEAYTVDQNHAWAASQHWRYPSQSDIEAAVSDFKSRVKEVLHRPWLDDVPDWERQRAQEEDTIRRSEAIRGFVETIAHKAQKKSVKGME